jgi:hypothetical protein
VQKIESRVNPSVNRRSFLKTGMLAGSAATVGAVLADGTKPMFAQGGRLADGDIAVLRFLATAELIEADLWQQYAELGGLTSGQPIEVDPNQTLNSYQAALSNLDTDGPQYITSNTNDELSHANFLNAYLESKGAESVNLDQFRTLQGSTASIASKTKRLTNLMNLNIRPLRDKFGGAVATIASFTADGLFEGQTPEFFQVVNQLAQAADAARRES